MEKGVRRLYSAWRNTWQRVKAPDLDTANSVLFGLYFPDGGCYAEMRMDWVPSQNGPMPRLGVFSDAWVLLAGQFRDVMRELAATGRDISPTEFVALLQRCGFSASDQLEGKPDEKANGL